MNTPLLDSFVGLEEIIAQFIVSRYHNGKLYFDTPVNIDGSIIIQITVLSNKLDLVPIQKTPHWSNNS